MNAAEAHKWLLQAARRDHPRALLLLGKSHVRWLRTEGCDELAQHSPQKATEFLERAAAQNVAEAYWLLAQIYQHPGFARRDLRLARQNLEKAAHAGVAPAQVLLARRLTAGRPDLEHTLQAGHWLQAAMDDPAVREEADMLMDGLADRAPEWSAEIRATQARLLDLLLAEGHSGLAHRLMLAARFGLNTRETLFIDLLHADQGWCLKADVGKFFHYQPWRLVRCIDDGQREALRLVREAALQAIRGEADLFVDAMGSTRLRARRMEALLGPLNIDPGLFIAGWKPSA